MFDRKRIESISIENLSPENLFEYAKHLEEQTTKRNESMWGAIKAIGVALAGTAAVGITATLVNFKIQETELALEEEKTKRQLQLEERKFEASDIDAKRVQEQNYLEQFLNQALHNNLQRRIDFAHYVSSVTLNKEMKVLWENYHGDLEAELTGSRADLKEKIAELERKLASAEEDTESVALLQREVDRLERRVALDTTPWVPNLTIRIVLEEGQLSLNIGYAEGSGLSRSASTGSCEFPVPVVGERKDVRDCFPTPRLDSALLTRVSAHGFELAVNGRKLLMAHLFEGKEITYRRTGYFLPSPLTSVVIPDDVTSIGSEAFQPTPSTTSK